MLLSLTVFSGCSYKATQPSAPISWFFECEPTIDYIVEPIEVKIPVKCKTKKTFCTKKGSLKSGTVEELLQCIYELRESNKSCE